MTQAIKVCVAGDVQSSRDGIRLKLSQFGRPLDIALLEVWRRRNDWQRAGSAHSPRRGARGEGEVHYSVLCRQEP